MALIPELGRHTPYETTKDNAFERFPEIRGRYEHPEGVDILSVHEVKRWFNDATEVSLYGSRLIKYHVRRKSFGASISESAEKQLQVSSRGDIGAVYLFEVVPLGRFPSHIPRAHVRFRPILVAPLYLTFSYLPPTTPIFV
jgi:hypothetical protein